MNCRHGAIGIGRPGYRDQVQNVSLDGVLVPIGLFAGGAWENWNNISTDLLDSVTLVRGSTGLLTGSGEPGGSMALRRKRPTETFQGSATLSLESGRTTAAGRWRWIMPSTGTGAAGLR